jgi:hypothetical protein
VTNRALTTADLNVPDTDATGACGLHAAVPSSGEMQVSTVTAPGQGANGVNAGASPASPQTVAGNGPRGAVNGHDPNLSSLRAVNVVEAAGMGSSTQAGTGLNAPAAGSPAGWSATSPVAGAARQVLAAPFTAWGTHPLLSGGDETGDSGRVGVTSADALSPAALDAVFGSGTERARGPIGSETGESAGVGGARGGLGTTPDQGDGKDAREVQVPVAGPSSLFALLGALWGNLWGARTDEPESRKQRQRR